MRVALERPVAVSTEHDWWREVGLAVVPGYESPLVDEVIHGIKQSFISLGHCVQDRPDNETDLLLVSARFGDPVPWRKAPMFTARGRYRLRHTPTVYTLLHITPDELATNLDRLQKALEKKPPSQSDFSFPGLAPTAYRVLIEQGLRGGPLLAFERMVQAQVLSIRILLLVGDTRPEEVYHFDLVGAFPRSSAGEGFYEDIVLRMVTAASTYELRNHAVTGETISQDHWQRLHTPKEMEQAARQLDSRNFFTQMVRIADLVHVPMLADVVADQYSEGCFATWDPQLGAMVSTVTGSQRPVDKGKIGEDDLAVIAGVQPDGSGVLVRPIEGKANDLPSSESVELFDMDRLLPTIDLGVGWSHPAAVPVVRSKLHGHRGVASYDPHYVEHVALDPAYYRYPVSCATEAQARAIKSVFSRSHALQNPEDSRQVVFTILPGHGVVMVEKWVEGKVPLQVLWEAMDAGVLVVENQIPQGFLRYVPDPTGRMVLEAE